MRNEIFLFIFQNGATNTQRFSYFYMNLWMTQPGNTLTVIVKIFSRKIFSFCLKPLKTKEG